ncbi:hypothetical protein CaCOL14_007042 [Colletotrichum acutatum]
MPNLYIPYKASRILQRLSLLFPLKAHILQLGVGSQVDGSNLENYRTPMREAVRIRYRENTDSKATGHFSHWTFR